MAAKLLAGLHMSCLSARGRCGALRVCPTSLDLRLHLRQRVARGSDRRIRRSPARALRRSSSHSRRTLRAADGCGLQHHDEAGESARLQLSEWARSLMRRVGTGDQLMSERMRAAVLVDVDRVEVHAMFRRASRRQTARSSFVCRRLACVATDLQIFGGHSELQLRRLSADRPIPLTEHPQISRTRDSWCRRGNRSRCARSRGRRSRSHRSGTHLHQAKHRTRRCASSALSGDSHQCEDYKEHGITGHARWLRRVRHRALAQQRGTTCVPTLAPEHRGTPSGPLGCIATLLDVHCSAAPRRAIASTRRRS